MSAPYVPTVLEWLVLELACGVCSGFVIGYTIRAGVRWRRRKNE